MTVIRAAARFFAGAGFPAFALTLLIGFEVLLLVAVLVPIELAPLAAFAEELKLWCLGLDPATGHLEPMYAVTLFSEPAALALIITLFWWRPLAEARARRAGLLGPMAAGAVLVLGAAAALGVVARPPAEGVVGGELPFPAERLRTAIPAPAVHLLDQDGAPVSLEALRGRVVLLTAVYSRCGVTCPMILAQTRRVLDVLSEEEKRRLTVVAITLDPEHDDVAAMAALARAQQVSAPLVRMASGAPAAVNDALDALGIARRRDPQTGVIEHANLFLLVDASGRLAYRLAPGPREERWLLAALRVLLAEVGAPRA